MKKIESFDEVLYLLKQREILFLIQKRNPTYFVMIENDRIRVNNEQVNYFITMNQLKELFISEIFYLYEKKKQNDILVSDEKDIEYYSWKHK